MKLTSIKTNENNPRLIKKEKLNRLIASIKEFPDMFEKRPIVVDENNVALGGNMRLKALKQLGYTEIPDNWVIKVDNWTEEQKKEFIIKDNVSYGEWDWDILTNEWEMKELNNWGVDIPNIDFAVDDNVAANDNTDVGNPFDSNLKFENFEKIPIPEITLSGRYEIPLLTGIAEAIEPINWIGFNYVKTTSQHDVGVHFFVDDYQFNRIWSEPAKYAKLLSPFLYVLTPDFSIYSDTPMVMQMWKHYQKHWFGVFLERSGVKVVPTLCWSDTRSYEFCFDGVPQNGVVAVSSVGVMANKEAKEMFLKGYNYAINQLNPVQILFFGTIPDEIADRDRIVHIPHLMDERFKLLKADVNVNKKED